MKVHSVFRRVVPLLLTIVLLLGLLPISSASAKTVAEWLEGYRTGKDWFGDDVKYDITDEAACWALLMKPITVLAVGETESVYPLKTPGGEKVNNDKLGGFINGASAAVHVLGEDEDGWTLIEGIDYYNRIIQGYVKTKLLKQITPNAHYGVIIDKLTQRLNVFIDGKFFSSCAVSTGLPNDEQPYNETSAGEYVCISWSGGFDSEGMACSGDPLFMPTCLSCSPSIRVTALRVRVSILSQSLASIAFWSTIQLPPQATIFGKLRYSNKFASPMPPVGKNCTFP